VSGPIYKVWLGKFKDAFYELSEDEQNKLGEKVGQALVQAGGETVIMCNAAWGSENYQGWGVEKFPDIEAVQKHTELLIELNWYHYMDSTSYLGTEWQVS
jgi:hypothetical protein